MAVSGGNQIGPAAADRAVRSAPGGLADRLSQKARGQFAIALDATGSMQTLIGMARAGVGEVMRRVSAEAGIPVSLRLYVYRDYDCVGSAHPVLEHTDLTADVDFLRSWLGSRVAAGGGGNDGEAIEAALADILHRNEVDAVLIAGDEPSNSKAHLAASQQAVASAHDLAPRFKERGCPVHLFALGQNARTHADFRVLSAATGGQFGHLDGGPDMIDLAVLAMLARLRGSQGVRRYAEAHALSENAKTFAAALLPKPGDKA